MTIYIVEDDPGIREVVLYALKSARFEAEGFESGAEFFSATEKSLPNLVLLDIMLPGEDGISILKKLRSAPRTKALPVIMLTAKDNEVDKVRALDMGADDYIPKPFGVMEMISRVNAVLRRTVPENPLIKEIVYANIVLNNAKREVYVNSKKITGLTFKEFELLRYLAENAENALNREKIMKTVWGYDYEGESRTLDMHIRSLRRKLGEAGGYIRTIRNVGYKMGE
ncbi:MAG: response regulator transcription factor [Oscillospiraceae bacterium]|jgi:two-component system alkaline phosphatase synthesis response regulator PhoP|nr:response regulator transcription factor [Oscillospiraceae bacterium]